VRVPFGEERNLKAAEIRSRRQARMSGDCARAAPRLARGSRLRASRAAASDRDIPCALTENTSITSSRSLADPITDKLSRRKEGIRVRV